MYPDLSDKESIRVSGSEGFTLMVNYQDHLQLLKTNTISSALQLLAQAGRETQSLTERRDCVETCNRVLEQLAGRTTTSLHKHTSSNTYQKPQPVKQYQ